PMCVSWPRSSACRWAWCSRAVTTSRPYRSRWWPRWGRWPTGTSRLARSSATGSVTGRRRRSAATGACDHGRGRGGVGRAARRRTRPGRLRSAHLGATARAEALALRHQLGAVRAARRHARGEQLLQRLPLVERLNDRAGLRVHLLELVRSAVEPLRRAVLAALRLEYEPSHLAHERLPAPAQGEIGR